MTRSENDDEVDWYHTNLTPEEIRLLQKRLQRPPVRVGDRVREVDDDCRQCAKGRGYCFVGDHRFQYPLVFSRGDVPHVEQGPGDDTLTGGCRFVIQDLF